MAKRKKVNKKLINQPTKENRSVWLENKILKARMTSEYLGSRGNRFGGFAILSSLLILTFFSYFSTNKEFQTAKIKLIKNPNDLEAHLVLAEEFIKNNELDKAQKEIALSKKYPSELAANNSETKVLGLNSRIFDLEAKWKDINPQEIQKNISYWENLISQSPTYRDAYLQLVLNHYKLGNKEKALENLKKAIEMDPSYEVSKNIEQLIK